MNAEKKEALLKISMIAFGAVFMLVYPLGLVWPAGWVWHGGDGYYYLHMIIGVYFVLGIYLIMASRNPSAHGSLIGLTAWSSLIHALVMGYYGFQDAGETGHLIGDVPALILVWAVFLYLNPRGAVGVAPAE